MNLLFLAHRIPYPPNKGDKIRSWNELRYLASRHRVHLGCLADQPEDLAHVPALAETVSSLEVVPIDARWARLRSLGALVSRDPLSVRYFESKRLRRYVDRVLRDEEPDAVFVFSSVMAEYVWDAKLPRVMDFCDVDSDKWRQYAHRAPLPLRPIYALEAGRLRSYEAEILRRFDAATLVTSREKELWADWPDSLVSKVHVVPNGVDVEYFTQGNTVPRNPHAMVFTGAMDYYANVDAVTFFVEEVFPKVRAELPDACFYIAGSRPTSRVQALARVPGVVVTGFVDDIRTYYDRASLSVVPLRIARGIQNKVLEAMAMGLPVLATQAAAAGLGAASGAEIRVADAPEVMAREAVALLRSPQTATALGTAGRRFVEREYVWDRSLRRLEMLIEAAVQKHAPVSPEPVSQEILEPVSRTSG